MAIDTREKRASALGRRVPRRRLPLPDGVIDAGDRQQLAGYYRGIAAPEPPPNPKYVMVLKV